MKQTLKRKILSLLLVMAMQIAILPFATPARAATGAGFKFELEIADATADIYKLVFSARTNSTIQLISLRFSFDKAIVEPVVYYDSTLPLDLTIEPDGPWEPLLIASGAGTITARTFPITDVTWLQTTDRMLANVTTNHATPGRTAPSSGAYVPACAFYFKFQSGKTTADITADTFKIEDGNDPNTMLSEISSNSGVWYGILMDGVSGVDQYRWGSVDQSSWQSYTTIFDEVINPYDIPAPSALTGTVAIMGGTTPGPVIGDTLTASVSPTNNTGTLSYQWKAGTTNVGSGSSTYTVAVADLGQNITVEVTSSVETGMISRTTGNAVIKKPAPTTPAAPTTASKTSTSVTLTTVAGNEYSDGTTWQSSPIFSGLIASTAYTFYQRVAETPDTYASATSAVLNETTNAPPPPGTHPTIITTSLAGGTAGVPYSDNLIASGSAPITWTVAAGSNLPAGLSLNASTGVISGTPTAAGSFTFTVLAANGNSPDGTQSLTIVIAAAPATYTVSYNANGGSGTVPAPDTVSSGASYTIVANPFSRTGYNFTGWSTAATGGTPYAAGATIPSVTANVTLYAQWTSVGSSGGGGGGTSIPAANNLSSATGAFEKTVGEANNKDITVTLTQASGATLTDIKNGNTVLIEGVDYTKSGNSYTIKKEYLNSLTEGTHTLTFDMNNGVDPKFTIAITQNPVDPPVDPPADGWTNPFIDVDTANWFYGNVKYVHQNNLFAGTSANTFSPQMSMSRGMVVTVLGRLAGIDTATYGGASFSDVDGNMYYSPYVKWAVEKGIVSGVGDNKFAPDANISRQDLAVILYNYAEKMDITLPDTMPASAFNDYADISGYASVAVDAIKKAGIITGKPGNVFDPKGNATRAEVAAMMQRFCELIK